MRQRGNKGTIGRTKRTLGNQHFKVSNEYSKRICKGRGRGRDWKDLAAEWTFGEGLVRDFWVRAEPLFAELATHRRKAGCGRPRMDSF